MANRDRDPEKYKPRPRIVYPDDICPEDSNNPYSQLNSSEEIQEYRRLFGLEQDPT